MCKIKQEHIYFAVIWMVIICVFQYGVRKICGFSLYPDEFGYWGSAAHAVGYDWSEVVSMGGYYSFGYSLILAPVLKLFSGGTEAYRAAIAVNAFLMCVSAFLLLKIAGKIFPELEKTQMIFMSSVAVLYPSWIFYMQTTMTEAFLCFLFVLIFYLFLVFIEKPSAIKAVILAISLMYMYCVHMRTIGVVLSVTMVLVLWGIVNTKRKKYLLMMAVIFVIAGWGITELKNYTILEVFSYAKEESIAGNDYSGQWGKIKQIFSYQGIFELIQGMIGKFFYLGISSFGVFYWAFAWCVKESVLLIKKLFRKELVCPKQWGVVFLFITVTGGMLISSIYMSDTDKIDGLIYGRYNELFVPIMILVGITIMKKSNFLLWGTLLIEAMTGGMAWFLSSMVEKRNLSGIRGYHIAGVSYLIREDEFNSILYFRNTWILGFALIMLAGFLIWLSRYLNKGSWVLAGILLIEIIAGLQISNHYIYRTNNSNFENQIIAEVIRDNYEASDAVVYLDEGYPEFIDFLQMQLPDLSIHVIKEDDLSAEMHERFLIAYTETKKDRQLLELYDKKVTASAFCLYYNR